MSNNSSLPIIAVGALGLSSISCVVSSLTGFLVSDDSNVESNTSTDTSNTSTSNTNTSNTSTSNTSTSNTSTSNTSTSNTSTSNTSTSNTYTIPYQIDLGTDEWCWHPGAVHQDVPGCGRICSDLTKIGSKTDGTWGPWESTTIACNGAKLDEIWEVQDDGTRKLADGYSTSKLKEGISVQCTTNDLRGSNSGSVYRVNSNGILDYYPSPSIAETWNPDWNVGIKQIADCTGLTKGKDLGYAPGTSVQCTTNDLRGREGSVYRIVDEENIDVRYYPSPSIAETWNPDWNVNIKQIADCTGLTKGEDLEMKT